MNTSIEIQQTELPRAALIADMLSRSSATPSEAMLQNFCLPLEQPDDPRSGCRKYELCPIHPEAQKSWTAKEIREREPDVWRVLKENNCNRYHIATNPALERRLLQGEQVYADFCGSLAKDAGKLSGCPHCPLNGCVVPEMRKAGDNMEALAKVCPSSNTEESGKTRQREPNQHRLTACQLTRPETLDLQKDLRIATISPIILLPDESGRNAQILYVSKSREGGFQFAALDPDCFGTAEVRELRQGHVRLHAPLLARHHFSESTELEHLAGQRDTLKWLAALTSKEGVSRLEMQLGCRYISAGEFAFLCLMWLWSGEDHTGDLSVGKVRTVVVEGSGDTTQKNGTLLFDELKKRGLLDGLVEIYRGDLEKEDGLGWTLTSSRLKDFYHSGLITDADLAKAALTPKATVLSQWLEQAVTSLSGAGGQNEDRFDLKRVHGILAVSDGRTAERQWLGQLATFARALGAAARAEQGAEWIGILNQILEAFGQQTDRRNYRKYLREEAFPVYPPVHVTMLFGIDAALDWLAIPLGATLGAHASYRVKSYPQAAAFLLAEHRSVEQLQQSLLPTIRVLLNPPVLADSSKWSQHVLLRERQQYLDLSSLAADRFGGVVNESPLMKEAVREAMAAARSNSSVLLLGERGTGKTMLANLIHQFSNRSDHKYVPFPGTRYNREMFASELFGTVKGAFTGAVDKEGAVETANGGTLFFDELGDIPLDSQAVLLAFTDDDNQGRFTRVGSQETKHADVRFISATKQNLEEMVKAKTFRDDLYDRMATDVIICPSLRDCKEDILPLLIHYFRKSRIEQRKGDAPPSLSIELYQAVVSCVWSGNSRSVKRFAEYLAGRDGNHFELSDLSIHWSRVLAETTVKQGGAALATATASVAKDEGIENEVRELQQIENPPVDRVIDCVKRAMHSRGISQADCWEGHSQQDELGQLVAYLFKARPALTQSKLRERTGISLPTLYRMRDHGTELFRLRQEQR